jgi:prepilin peptidase CpaA
VTDIVMASGAAALSAAAAVSDVRTGRIPNALTFGAAAIAVLVALAERGAAGLLSSVVGGAIGLAVFLPFFALGGLGGGDVKLLAAVGAWLGPREVLWVALWGTLAGGALGLVMAASRNYLREAFGNVGALLALWWTTGLRPAPGLTLGDARGPRLPYAVPIGAGVLLTLWLGRS